MLYVFVVIEHRSRRLIHCNVTAHLTEMDASSRLNRIRLHFWTLRPVSYSISRLADSTRDMLELALAVSRETG